MNSRWFAPVLWALILTVSCLTQAYITVADDARRGVTTAFGWSFEVQATSHIVLAALIPAIYWMQRRFPVASPRNVAIHAVALVVFSVVHTLGMAALRMLWFEAILGQRFRFPITLDRLWYEFTKDIFTYCVMNLGVVLFHYLRERQAPPAPVVVAPAETRPERFAVRKRGGSEVMVEVADIDWIEASDNYVCFHCGRETHVVRETMSELEARLDPAKFLRVHRSAIVNLDQIRELQPWFRGDYRVILRDGTELTLTKNHREKLEARLLLGASAR